VKKGKKRKRGERNPSLRLLLYQIKGGKKGRVLGKNGLLLERGRGADGLPWEPLLGKEPTAQREEKKKKGRGVISVTLTEEVSGTRNFS